MSFSAIKQTARNSLKNFPAAHFQLSDLLAFATLISVESSNNTRHAYSVIAVFEQQEPTARQVERAFQERRACCGSTESGQVLQQPLGMNHRGKFDGASSFSSRLGQQLLARAPWLPHA
jgi:hypothetical protein